jgi:ribonuclease Z
LRLIILGSCGGYPEPGRACSGYLVESGKTKIWVDAGTGTLGSLLRFCPLDDLDVIMLTHLHPDHWTDLPIALHRLAVTSGGSIETPIPVYGPEAALSQARRILESFDMTGWEGLPDIEWHEVPLREEAPVLEDADWRVTASPGEHSVPVIAVRIEARGAGRIAYSADTGPVATVARLARGVDILVHEASGEFPGHSTMGEAARIAADARAGRLVLVHLPPEPSASELAMARKRFDNLELGEDGARYRF